MLRCYVPKRFTAAHELVIEQANEIIERYMADGHRLTLRQIYYRFVAQALLENKQTEYKRLGGIINDARLAGRIDWDAIEDRGRGLMGINAYEDPADIVGQMAQQYHLDHWADQEIRVEVWVEKQALEGVVGAACGPLDVDFFSCKGYMSQSEMWRASQRFARYRNAEQRVVMIHLGDHDPSGIDMTRDLRERTVDVFGVGITVVRIALNMPQIEEFGPPPNPTKLTDSRAGGYIEQFGLSSWELDALEPAYLEQIIQKNVWSCCDREKWDAIHMQQEEERELLSQASLRWDELQALL